MMYPASRIRELERRVATLDSIVGVLADQINQTAGLLAELQRDSISIGRGVVSLLDDREARETAPTHTITVEEWPINEEDA